MSNEIKESELYIIEDEPVYARGYEKDLNLYQIVSGISYVDDSNSLIDALSSDTLTKVFWVDIHLGMMYEDFIGISWIKMIRSKCPGALIIVHTAYDEKKEACLNAGADHFFVKENYEETIRKIRQLISIFLDKSKQSSRLIEYPAVVAHVNEEDNWVKLICFFEGSNFSRVVPLEPVAASVKDELNVNTFLNITIIEKDNSIKIVFDKMEERNIPPAIAEQWAKKETEEGNEMDHDFWTNKL